MSMCMYVGDCSASCHAFHFGAALVASDISEMYAAITMSMLMLLLLLLLLLLSVDCTWATLMLWFINRFLDGMDGVVARKYNKCSDVTQHNNNQIDTYACNTKHETHNLLHTTYNIQDETHNAAPAKRIAMHTYSIAA